MGVDAEERGEIGRCKVFLRFEQVLHGLGFADLKIWIGQKSIIEILKFMGKIAAFLFHRAKTIFLIPRPAILDPRSTFSVPSAQLLWFLRRLGVSYQKNQPCVF